MKWLIFLLLFVGLGSADSWITNSSVGWDGVFTNTVEYGDGGVRLDHNQTGLVAWWDFENDTVAYDSSSNDNDGTLVGPPDYVTGYYGQGYDFDGVSDYVDCGNDNSLNFTGQDNFTIEAWLKLSSISSVSIVSKNRDVGPPSFPNSGGYELLTSWDYRASVRFFTNSSGSNTTKTVYSTTRINLTDTWYHIVGIRTSTQLRIYVNGEFENSVDYDMYTDSIEASDLNVALGSLAYDIGNYGLHNGTLDQVKIYNLSLSAEEINATMRGETRHQTGNYTSPTHDTGSGNIAKNISVTFTDKGADTKMNIYTKTSYDNTTWTGWELAQADITGDTEYALITGRRYIQYRVEENTTNATKVDAFYTVTVKSEADITAPTVTWYNQTNSTGGEVDIDINTRRLLNLTWNLTDASSINISSCSIQVRINDTTINSTDWHYNNETLSSNLDANGWWTHPCNLSYASVDNTSISIYAELPDTLYYRATTLAIPISDITNDTTDTIYGSNVVMLENSNATIEANYLYVTKHNLNSKTNTVADSRQWYCNKTYKDEGWGDFRTSQYCGIGASIHESDTKVDGSNYFERYGSSDENATFAGIGITDPSYFITESIYANNENQGWEQKGTSGHSGHSYVSDDYGVTWTLKPDTEFDMVIQWFNSMYFEARVNITDNEGNTIIDLQQDYFDTVNRAPEAAFKKDCDAGGLLTVYNECNISELGTLNISADFLDPDTNLVNCTFILLNNDSSYNQTLSEIETNTSYGICSFQYDTTAITNGDYYFKVNVTDGLLTGSDSTYDFVRIENPPPEPVPTWTQTNALNIWLLIIFLTLAMTLHILGILIESSTINFTAYSLFLLIGLAIMAAGIQIESGETATVVGDITTKIATFSIINTIFINSYGVTILLYGLYGMITAYTGRKLEDDDEDREFNRQEEYFNERT